MRGADRRVLVALAEHDKGAREATGHNDGEDVKRYTGGLEVNWCGGFASWVCEAAGTPIPGSRADHLAVIRIVRIMQEHEWVHRDPLPGDLILMHRHDTANPDARHTGIVVDVNGRAITSIDGNIGNKVARVTRHRDDRRIIGYGRIPETQ